MKSPFLSVVVPTRQSADVLARSLQALRATDLPAECWELIVVDDASTDESAAIAATMADVVVRLPGEVRGTGYALNRGFDAARGEYVAFVSAGVCVLPSTLRELVTTLATRSDVAAVCAGFDCDAEHQAGLVSSYPGLYESHLHVQSNGESDSLWASCTVVRASVFAQAGMFDEWSVGRPRAAAAEMGRRFRSVGARILLRTDVCVRPIRQFTLRQLLVSALRDDGLPSTPVDVQAAGGAPRAGRAQRVDLWSTFLMVAVPVLAAVAVVGGAPLAWVGVVALLAAVDVMSGSFYAHVARLRGTALSLRIVPLHLLRMICSGLAMIGGWFYRHLLGERRPRPTIQAFAEVGLTMWPPIPARRRSASVSVGSH